MLLEDDTLLLELDGLLDELLLDILLLDDEDELLDEDDGLLLLLDDGTTQQHRIAAGKGIILHQDNSKVDRSQVGRMVRLQVDQVDICILVE